MSFILSVIDLYETVFPVLLQSGSRRRVIRRDSSLRVELGELSSELDLDIIGRLEVILQALRHCPASPQRNKAQAAEVTKLSWLKTTA